MDVDARGLPDPRHDSPDTSRRFHLRRVRNGTQANSEAMSDNISGYRIQIEGTDRVMAG
ncbi:MAG: hypothetical protein O3C49_06225 [Proteobacteria bacterium]|nr:hypothetical protein [Pseudomonadota bacterium]MDA1325714.1 hypothetical protein [Pseudomonadota bacterium]